MLLFESLNKIYTAEYLQDYIVAFGFAILNSLYDTIDSDIAVGMFAPSLKPQHSDFFCVLRNCTEVLYLCSAM